MKKVGIVGAGFFGAVCARELQRLGYAPVVLEARDHLGGNCFTQAVPEAGCHEHVYGAHIFHTSSERVWSYVTQFAPFNTFVNRVKARHGDRIYSLPINLFTLHQVFGVCSPAEAAEAIARDRLPIESPKNLEEYCLATVGPRLYRLFIEGYTAKQWGMHPSELPADIIKRLPVRFSFDDNYFNDRYQGIPIGGYTAIFEKLLEGVRVELGVDFLADRDHWLSRFDFVIYSGSIDRFFDYSHGMLGYRSLRFERELLPVADYQGNAVVNYTSAEVPYTRILEHKHFGGAGDAPATLITREYPEAWDRSKDAYYPVNTPENQQRFEQYRALARQYDGKVHFGGRLGEYRYYDMHQVISSALDFLGHFTR
jgi:UDP-galactopyranose mutase